MGVRPKEFKKLQFHTFKQHCENKVGYGDQTKIYGNYLCELVPERKRGLGVCRSKDCPVWNSLETTE